MPAPSDELLGELGGLRRRVNEILGDVRGKPISDSVSLFVLYGFVDLKTPCESHIFSETLVAIPLYHSRKKL